MSYDNEEGVFVSKFDYSVENHFKAMDKIGLIDDESLVELDETEIQRLSSSVSFVRKWRDFCYQPRDIRFDCESKTPREKDFTGRINLPQFSSAAVPKDFSDGNESSSALSKDFVMYVGGHVWALDWCPRVHQSFDYDCNVEFIAVSAHPPESSYHIIGAPLSGRGLIQIWCILNTSVKDQDVTSSVKVKTRKYTKNKEAKKPKDNNPKRPHEHVTEKEDIVGKRRPKSYKKEETLRSMLTSIKSKLKKSTAREKSLINADNLYLQQNLVLEPVETNDSISEDVALPRLSNADNPPLQQNLNVSISEDVAFPRLVMGLTHHGKVAWDVKWKPIDSRNISMHRMGYLAVLLGSGALEVWEIPIPRATQAIFSSYKTEGADPRFVELKPVFTCSMLQCGDIKSIPITVEWSTAAPHDLILAGCHDGKVALWKFSSDGPSEGTRPLICFRADTVPIRALKWAPQASDPESANIIATSGHNGLKFWDLRDPHRPLWGIPTEKIIYSLDWLPDSSCVILSFDDGEIRILSLLRAASDVPITGMPCEKTQQSGSHIYRCSSSSIWSIHTSTTRMVAYCCSDGKVIHFQLTARALGKDYHRYREPHYLCGSLALEGSTLTVFTPLPNVPFTLKRYTSRSKCGVLSRYNQEKRAKKEISKCQVTGDNSDSEDEMVTTQKKKTSQKTKTGKELVETLPPKIIAMHRVRWNMNKGSESLLCYGGASGIVRCQQICP